jgi:hypothetical protein
VVKILKSQYLIKNRRVSGARQSIGIPERRNRGIGEKGERLVIG